MWVLSDADTTVYLFGTIHLLPKGIDWKGGKLDDALAKSDELIIETIIDEKNPMQFMNALNSLASSPNLPPLRERVGADKRPALDAAVKASGLPAMVYDRMETWAAAFLLLGSKFRGIGLAPEDGVEIVLRKSFIDRGKPIEALESNAEQLSFFDRLPEEAQRSLLEGAIGTDKDMKTEFTSMLEAWQAGDVEKIAKTFDKDLAETPALRDALMVQRNRNWAKWIAERMDEPGSVMVAVGAGHLAGSDSVQNYLKAKGYRVERVQ
jgi:uncharacterized protein YbaP (TraB family)